MAFCQTCGKELNPSDSFCTNCGAKTGKIDFAEIAGDVKSSVKTKISNFNQPISNQQNNNQQIYQNNSPTAEAQPVTFAPVNTAPVGINYQSVDMQIPSNYKPLGAWSFFGYSILFSIPIIGFIINIFLCFNSNNLSRRNYARSFWCWYIIIALAAVIIIASGASILSIL